jgi:hypothetical protein
MKVAVGILLLSLSIVILCQPRVAEASSISQSLYVNLALPTA